VSATRITFDADAISLAAGGMHLSDLQPLVDGAPIACGSPTIAWLPRGWTISWPILKGVGKTFVLHIENGQREELTLAVCLEAVDPMQRLDALGIRIGCASGVARYLRNGYTSWDGSYFIELESARETLDKGSAAFLGYAMTALVAAEGGVLVCGFLRHDRFQSRVRFALEDAALSIDFETLLDRVPLSGLIAAESLILITGAQVEETLRGWANHVASAAPQAPRLPSRIVGWCSWYNLYASITESVILEHLRAAIRFRNRYDAPLEVFQIDDGFTPEMGDWLEVKPQFPRGMAPLLAEIREAGFMPGLWIAPFMVGNRSKLYLNHPAWVVRDRTNGGPLSPLQFYGEFRWHKRSEEYYVLDVTHPDAADYIRKVFRVWRREWGCAYFKTDFMYFGAEYGPDRAIWHEEGLSRIEIWMRMARLIREEIGAALWLECGGPLWAPVGLIDAARIGRDVGVSWRGNQSAESLLRDQTSRNFGNGILWQADPDCVLLRSRFHHLSDGEVRSLLLFAGLSGGLLLTSDQFDEISEERRELFTALAGLPNTPCEFPRLGRAVLRHRMSAHSDGKACIATESSDPVIVQKTARPDGCVIVNVFNTGEEEAQRLIGWNEVGCVGQVKVSLYPNRESYFQEDAGVRVYVAAHEALTLLLEPV
jgi:alpha-galactosidase